MSTVPTIDVVNESTVLGDADVTPLVHALQAQIAEDFRPQWNTGCRLVQARSVGKTSWGLVILDDSDQAGALGYHDLTASGLPLGKVFAKDVLTDGMSWTVTASHELLEMLADPWIDSAVQVGSSTFYSLEVCDACEDDSYGYTIQGVEVSDFVLPAWFRPDTATGPFDLRGHITQPLELLTGGYIGAWTPRSGWQQKVADEHAPVSRRIPLRQKKHAGETLVRSTRGEA